MKKLNPIEKSKYINDRYKEYVKSSYHFETKNLQQLFERQLDKENLFKGPYININLPFKRGKNVYDLVKEGVLCKSFLDLNNIDFERSLYLHQEEAIKKVMNNKNVVVTTGTGSGKTECFMFPILNQILKEIENGNDQDGIRAIFLYPMNALVNDQINRIREILKNIPEIRFGFFTGETPETIPNNFRDKQRANGEIILDNELISRNEIRKHPPHLLFTNYSMLEHLLIRPYDYSIFKPEKLTNWKYVVLDEAHTYNGALGIEISYLLRRLTGLSPKKPNFILTSATLGIQGKSEDDIVKFAQNLTSSQFNKEDIIFSQRILLNREKVKFEVRDEDYIFLKSCLNNNDEVYSVVSEYNISYTENTRELIYNLLISDKNVYQLYDFLHSESRSFYEVLNKFNKRMTAEGLICLIDLINFSEKNGVGIFDLKYHSFIRPISGAYVTLNENPSLSLTKTNYLNGYKAFELGNCRYCNAPYIIGKIKTSHSNGLKYLFQNDEIDIYENYGDNEYIELDYFLLTPQLDSNDNNDEIDEKSIDECIICTKCGCIYSSSNLNSTSCDCGEQYKTKIYKVLTSKNDSSEPKARNNINYCPCCGHKKNSGIVKSFSMGKDEGTSLTAQILYEAIDENEYDDVKKQEHKISLLLSKKRRSEKKEYKVKQFLTFSDSRQQASFAAVFMNSNHTRLLRKRLIWHVIESQSYKDLSVRELVAYLSRIIERKELFSDSLNPDKNAWIAVLIDLLKVDGVYDAEGLGLYYFDLNLDIIEENLNEEVVEEYFGKYHLNLTDLITLMKVIFDVFKVTPAINYVDSKLDWVEKSENLDFRRFNNYVAYHIPKYDSNIKSLLPIRNGKENQLDNMYVRYVEKVCDCNVEEAKEILNLIFNELAVEVSKDCLESNKLLEQHETEDAYQINVNRYTIKNYKNSKFYQCTKCGRITPYNVHDKCVSDYCDGKLKEINPDEILKNNYYRNEYKNKKIEKIIIKEHTAQLDRKTARQYQEDFKNKKINILSCSTTFEMGVDIGNLETVFMRNIPPTPANYVQRAGRAGRRKDSSAFILTYCGATSHDYTYFDNPYAMISGIVNPPYFDVYNKKMILRHLMASSLGYFFRRYPEYYNTIDDFVFKDGYKKFEYFISEKPKELMDYIDKKVIPGSLYEEYHNFNWLYLMDKNDRKLDIFVDSVLKDNHEFETAIEKALQDKDGYNLDYFKGQINRLHKEKTIEYLSKYCVIPKYGFPVDVVNLDVYNENGNLETKYDLTRDLKIAISEYAPDSEVIVDGKKYTSKYIGQIKSKELEKNYYCECPICKKMNVAKSPLTDKCIYCNSELHNSGNHYFIEPIYGFKTGENKENTRLKPKKSYSGEISYLGGGLKGNKLVINDFIVVETSTDDELLIMNKSYFYMCKTCGYSEIVKTNITPSTIEKEHKNYRHKKCVDKILNLVKIGHKFKTDVIRLTIPLLEIKDTETYSKAMSFLYALLEGISISLEIEREDIDGILEYNLIQNSYDLILFDNVPGGAGHVRRLMNEKAIERSLKAALVKVSQQCCDENTSCYNCLRNFKNQKFHEILKRGFAKEVIIELLSNF